VTLWPYIHVRPQTSIALLRIPWLCWLGGKVVAITVAIDLDFLKGRARFPNYDVLSLLHYDE
jgi:adenine/guanine phosphoribosyltransferase-like PRPP-binding protein